MRNESSVCILIFFLSWQFCTLPHFARAVHNCTGSYAIFRYPFVCHILSSPTWMNFPSFSFVTFRYLLFPGNILEQFMLINWCSSKDLNSWHAKQFRIVVNVNDEIKQIILGDVLEKLQKMNRVLWVYDCSISWVQWNDGKTAETELSSSLKTQSSSI